MLRWTWSLPYLAGRMRNPLVPTSPAVALQMADLLGPRSSVLDMGTGDGRLLLS